MEASFFCKNLQNLATNKQKSLVDTGDLLQGKSGPQQAMSPRRSQKLPRAHHSHATFVTPFHKHSISVIMDEGWSYCKFLNSLASNVQNKSVTLAQKFHCQCLNRSAGHTRHGLVQAHRPLATSSITCCKLGSWNIKSLPILNSPPKFYPLEPILTYR